PSVVVRRLFRNASLVGYPRFFVSQALVFVVLEVLSRYLCCTVEVCVVFLDTLTPEFELYVRLRERRQWDSDFPEFVLLSLDAPARDPRDARHGPAVVCLQSRFDSFEVCPGGGTVVTAIVACGVPYLACYGVPCCGTGLLVVSMLVPCGNRYMYPVWVMVCGGTSYTSLSGVDVELRGGHVV
ncbi:hypothetical protein Taro_021789, partial [Colocasia esculenta]|nr:hypothetical protein [Colocasia esculenta]